MEARDEGGEPPRADDVLSDLVAGLRAERDDWRRRALEAEAIAESLADELALTRAQAQREPAEPEDDDHLPLLDGAPPPSPAGVLTGSGDLAVVPVALGALAMVAALAAALGLVWRGPSLFAIGAAVVAGVLGVLAWNLRAVRAEVEVSGSVVVVTRGGERKRFDLASDRVRLDVRGRPDDPDWRVRLYRGSVDPADVDATMVDPEGFTALIRQHRPAG